MTLLITGSTGLVGQALVRYLLSETFYIEEPYKIRLLIREKKSNRHRQRFLKWCEEKRIDIFSGDLRNSEDVMAFTQVPDPESSILIHCGAIFNLWQPYKLLYDVNVNGTERILQAFHKNRIKKLVFLSSIAVYGELNGTNGQGIREDHPIDLHMKKNYELTKALGEELVREYQFTHPHKLITILRPSGIIGGSSSTLDMFSRMFIGRLVPLPRGGKDKISLVDSQDVARAIVFLSDFQKGNGEAYNLVSCTPTLREVVKELGQALQKHNLSIISIPLFIFKPCYYLARIIRKIKKAKENSILIPVLFDKLGQDILVDDRKIRKTGFKYTVTLSESMDKFGNFVSENPWYKQKLCFAL
ncbi:MAG: NAD(P)-dependent oxidoreductase [Candidatus Heimdallarchaeota archaeon]|nr:MAG: NAD(P)-dependent oxidoreductase [Candidatus Heimdallarchaeota archaeon]